MSLLFSLFPAYPTSRPSAGPQDTSPTSFTAALVHHHPPPARTLDQGPLCPRSDSHHQLATQHFDDLREGKAGSHNRITYSLQQLPICSEPNLWSSLAYKALDVGLFTTSLISSPIILLLFTLFILRKPPSCSTKMSSTFLQKRALYLFYLA